MEDQLPPISPKTPLTPSPSIATPRTPSAAKFFQYQTSPTFRAPIQLALRPASSKISKAPRLSSPRRRSRRSSNPRQLSAPVTLDETMSVVEASPVPPSECRAQPPVRPSRTAYPRAISRLSTPIYPLISLETGQEHPNFPRSILQFHLLTHEILDELCEYYHQTLPPHSGRYKRRGMSLGSQYPAPLGTKAWVYESASPHERCITRPVSLAAKRRRFGRFCGLQGCESPLENANNTTVVEDEAEQQRKMDEEVEKEWCRRMQRLREEEEAREKMGGARDWY